jgi:hypothetical protein
MGIFIETKYSSSTIRVYKKGHMSYQIFLRILIQLSLHSKVVAHIEGREVMVERIGKKWNLSTRLFSEEGFMPQSIRDCVSSTGILRWQDKGAFLKLDPRTFSVFLIQEMTPTVSYRSFRSLMRDFLQHAQEWQQTLRRLADQDHVEIALP